MELSGIDSLVSFHIPRAERTFGRHVVWLEYAAEYMCIAVIGWYCWSD
jgi:hypothetical protein